ncbi:YIP1 family protein [bacterium]|nr:YIP1 family protein [bacterium]
MAQTNPKTGEMSALGRLTGIFTSPKQVFQSIDRKPTWLVPFLVTCIVAVALQFLLMDIGMKDQLARYEAQDLPAEQMERIEQGMQGPMKYISLPFIPIGTLVVWLVVGGLLLLGSNSILGGNATFKKMFSLVAWTSLIGILGGILKSILIYMKGTTRGVTTSLATLLPTPELGETPSILYRLLSKLDLFTIWQLALWVIGLSVINKFDNKKSASLVIGLWIIWIILSVALGGIFSRFTG